MCGLAGSAGAGEVDVSAMLDTLVHRGPDHGGQWEGDGITLGHRRLSILDTSPAGHQPMASHDGRWQLTLNGEIYNHPSLRARLEDRGHEFRTRSDTEVLAEALAEWGTACIPELRGMFAIAAWDRERGELWLARDHFGKKPIFYREEGQTILWASELRALRAVRPLTPDPDCLPTYFHLGYVPAPASGYRGVRALPPGTLARWRAGEGLEATRYWDPGDIAREGDRLPLGVDELDERLAAAVERRRMSDVPLGAFLSGGVDSALVASYLCELEPGSPTITVGFDVETMDETEAARATAARLQTEHRIERVELPAAEALFDRFVEAFDQPFADGSAIPTLVLCEATRRQVTVALGGDGSDELFGGYARYRWYQRALGLQRWPWWLRAPVAGLLGSTPAARHRRMGRWLGQRDARSTWSEILRVWHAGRPEALLGSAAPASGALPGWEEDLEPLRAAAVYDLRTYLPGDILVKVDRASMAHSLEARSPFLDVDLAERVLRSPGFGSERGLGKPLLHELVRRRFPGGLGERPKKGFTLPQREWLRGPLRARLEAATDPDHLRAQGLFEPTEPRRVQRAFEAGDHGLHAPLWAFLCYQEWYRHHAQGGGTSGH